MFDCLPRACTDHALVKSLIARKVNVSVIYLFVAHLFGVFLIKFDVWNLKHNFCILAKMSIIYILNKPNYWHIMDIYEHS